MTAVAGVGQIETIFWSRMAHKNTAVRMIEAHESNEETAGLGVFGLLTFWSYFVLSTTECSHDHVLLYSASWALERSDQRAR